MTPVSELFALGIRDVLDDATMLRVFRSGYSRIPVWGEDGAEIVGILFAKDLLLIEARDATPVVAVLNFFRRHPVQAVFPDCRLGELLHTFHASRQHIAIVRGIVELDGRDPSYAVVGIVTYEDVIEEILQARSGGGCHVCCYAGVIAACSVVRARGGHALVVLYVTEPRSGV